MVVVCVRHLLTWFIVLLPFSTIRVRIRVRVRVRISELELELESLG